MPTQATATSTLSITKNLTTMAMSTLICSVKGMLGKYQLLPICTAIAKESRPDQHIILNYKGCASSTAMHCSELLKCRDNGLENHHTLYYLK